jgi:aryl-alcohol dehydrogenase-like predicted oxidoreductase
MIAAAADPNETHLHCRSHAEVGFRELGRTGFAVSEAGFGCYRVDGAESEHREALRAALLRGINLIDTSANYADGGSERLIGDVLAELDSSGEVSRASVVVVSKAGYLQGQNYEQSQQRKAAGHPWPDLVDYAPGLEHCIHPEFLEDQLTRSLDRLDLERIDVYLLHNPEYYLSWAHRSGVPLEQSTREYYRRIEAAFRQLEAEVSRGRIAWYGISSNTFAHPAEDEEHTSLERVIAIADGLGTDHHFGVIQFPMNLLETGGATRHNQSDGSTVLELAHRHNLGVLINRPLNALGRAGMIRLAEPHSTAEPISPSVIRERLDDLRRLEQDFERLVLPHIPASEAQRAQLLALVSSAQTLSDHWDRLGGVAQWRELLARQLVPRIQAGVGTLLQLREVLPSLLDWLHGYVETVERVHQSIGWFYEQQAREGSQALRAAVAEADAEWTSPVLSQSALRALRSTEGVSCVLVGMRRVRYVEDVLAELARPVDVKNRHASWERLQTNLQSLN